MDEARNEIEVRLARKLELEKQREKIHTERARLLSLRNELGLQTFSPSSRLNATIQRTINKIPELERELETLREKDQARVNMLRKPYSGELGIGSYEPWQLEDVYFVRDFVTSWVDEVLDFIMQGHARTNKRREIVNFAKRMSEEMETGRRNDELFQLSLDIERGIVAEVVREAARETAVNMLELGNQTKNMVNSMILDSVSQQTEAQDDNRDALIRNALLHMKKEVRRKGNADVWAHSQAFLSKEITSQGSISAEVDSFDGTVLHFHNITPYNDVLDSSLLSDQVDFRNKESQFWMGNTLDVSTLPLSRRCNGISCSALSADNSLMALGSVLGDILIWDLLPFPPRILRTSRGRNKEIVQLRWSMDSSHIVSVDDRGTVIIWSLGDTVSVPFEVKPFEPIERNLGFNTTVLLPLLLLESQDFVFREGPFSKSYNSTSKATAVAFHPSVSLLGKQSYLMVGFKNGDVVRIKYRTASSVMSIPQVCPTNGMPCKIARDMHAELFKSHQNGIMLISFVNNISPMVTVDDKGFINLWQYSQEWLSGFGWFVPTVKYKLDMAEVTYEPVLGAQQKVEFTDAVRAPNRKKTRFRQEMTQKRERVHKYLSSLKLGKPWKIEEKGDMVTYVFTPKHVPESEAKFHIVTYDESSGLLSSYVTRLYRPITVPCSRFVSCQVDASGSKLVFMLLFPEADPKEAHVSFVILDLEPSVAVSKNYINIPISKNDYGKCLHEGLAFALSRPIDATGTEYIVANVNGSLTAISLTTGNVVMAKAEPGWTGCQLNIKRGLIPSVSNVQVASVCNGLQIWLYAQRYNSAILFQLTDRNTQEQRLGTWRAFQKLMLSRADRSAEKIQASLQTMRRFHWNFGRHYDVHVECFIEFLVYEMIDNAIQTVDGAFSEDQRRILHAENMTMPFLRKVASQSAEENESETVSEISER